MNEEVLALQAKQDDTVKIETEPFGINNRKKIPLVSTFYFLSAFMISRIKTYNEVLFLRCKNSLGQPQNINQLSKSHVLFNSDDDLFGSVSCRFSLILKFCAKAVLRRETVFPFNG